MTVAAASAKNLLQPAKDDVGLVDMRAGTPVRAGTYRFEGADVITGWHHHELHQLEYALEGIAHVETAERRYLLPPQHGIWIPAGLRHRTTLIDVVSIAAFFDPAFVNINTDTQAHVVHVPPVLREMLTYATRWTIDRRGIDHAADTFFAALALLICDCVDASIPLWIPTSRDQLTQAAMDHVHADPANARLEHVAKAIGTSERTLRRRFPTTTGMTWRSYVTTTRLMHAIAQLTQTEKSVLQIATDVGYESPSAFARAFERATGTNPRAYRQRLAREP